MRILLVILELIGCIVCFIMSGIAVGGVSADTLMDKAKNSFNVTVPDAATEALSQIEGGSTWGYTFGFWVLLVVSGITIITIAVNRKKIRICAAIIVPQRASPSRSSVGSFVRRGSSSSNWIATTLPTAPCTRR